MSRQRNRASDTLSIELAKDFHDWAEFQAERDWFSVDASVAVYPISEMPDGVVNDLMKVVEPKDIFLHARYGAGIRETAVRHRINQALALHQSVMAAQSELNEHLNAAKEAFAAAAAEQAIKSADEIEGLEAANTKQASTDAPANRHDIPSGPLRWTLVTIPSLFSLRERFSDKNLDSKLIDQLLDRPVRQLPKATRHQLKALELLWADFPNFGPALTVIARSLRLQMHTGAAVRLPSMLLVGPPGIGKTEFSKRLAATLSFEVTFRSLAETSAGFILTGHSSQWAKSAAGLIAHSVIGCPEGKAPLLVLDELDKARSQSDWAVDQALLGLLEPSSAKTFRDENLDIELDTRPVSYLLTANRIDTIRPELLSRLRIVQIQPPTLDQMPAVIRSLDRAIRSETPALRRLFHPLGTDVIDCLAAQAPRLIRRTLEDAYADALQSPKVGRRRYVRTTHLGISSKRTDASKARRPPIPPIFVHLEGWQWLQ